MPEPNPNSERSAILAAHDVSKVYQMGDVEVHALRGVTVPLYAANRRCSTFSARSMSRARGKFSIMAGTSRPRAIVS